MSQVTTIGRTLVNESLPEQLRDPERVLDSKAVQELFAELAQDHPDKYVDTLHNLNSISRMAATEYGREASLKLSDLKIPPRLAEYRKQLRERVHQIAQDPNLTMHDKNDKIVKVMQKASETAQKSMEKETTERNNSFAVGIKHGFRGSPKQLNQILFGNMLTSDHKGNPVPVAGLSGFGEGITPSEYFADSYGSRKGFADVQFATAQSGFFAKQLAMMSQRLKVTNHDCGASEVGITVDGDDPEIMGSVLARDVAGIPSGTVVGKEHLNKLKSKRPMVRSVATCQQKDGICQRCSGHREGNKFPPVGAFVGITSARAVSEPLTQLGLSAKHGGPELKEKELSPFEEITQFMQVPKTFRGASLLAPIDGKVNQIVKAPQGGHYIHVGKEQVYVPKEREVTVSRGDVLEAGDILTDGTPNPAEVARYKHLGAGRDYFIDRYYKMLKAHGVPSSRRNVETLSRAFFDRVRVTRPEGLLNFSVGDLVPYAELQRDYEPRKDSEKKSPNRSVGAYLEKPVMHYTIGTRITPNVAKNLVNEGIKDITTHREDPGFEPEVIRVMDLPATDPDWKTRMAGFGLKKSFLQAATRGAKSPHESSSYVPSLINPTRL
ncbi:MAG: hypothetical protein ACYTEQ_09330 [Planctomycetota bacterium]|jgi:DNA-directed RNA polymerase subunit beta'